MKKILFISVIFLIVINISYAQRPHFTNGINYEDLLRIGSQNGEKAFEDLYAHYRFLKSDSVRLKTFLINREIKKSVQKYSSLTLEDAKTVEHSIEEEYKDSIYPLLIPYNRMSGDNISLVLLLSKKENYNDNQIKYLMDSAVDMARRLERDSALNVWDEEMEILRNTLDDQQLNRFFGVKNFKAIKAETDIKWNKLKEVGLTQDMDSTLECYRVFNYLNEKMKINDLYRHRSTDRRTRIAELKRHRPLIIRMYDAYERKRSGRYDEMTSPFSEDFKYIWTAYGNNHKSVDKAIQVLQEIDTTYSKCDAINILYEIADNGHNKEAMNALGVAYAKGLGVAIDSSQVRLWFEKAGENGYSLAYHNLGMTYKYGKSGFKQDFHNATSCFKKGADKGSLLCSYDYAFMLYKGLGCQQNYSEAVCYFSKAAEQLHAPSLYMLGLCYRNGFGVEKDVERGLSYLHRAEVLGFGAALEELRRENAESESDPYMEYNNLPLSMPNITTEFTETHSLIGVYEGVLVQYDWSGQYIIGEKPIKMNIAMEDGGLTGLFSVNGKDTYYHANMTHDGRLRFNKGAIVMEERYTGVNGVAYRLENADFNVWNDKLVGRLNLYSEKLKEPERPIYLELYKTTDTQQLKFADGSIMISPNPFNNQFIANFELIEDVPSVEVRMYNNSGVQVFKKVFGFMQKGNNTLVITPLLRRGTYVLNIKAGSQVLRRVVVKRGGE